jgi:hypothetical protein
VEVSGPDHQRRFLVEVAIGGHLAGAGTGGSRRSAETAAAAAALESLARETRAGEPPVAPQGAGEGDASRRPAPDGA